MHDQLSDDCPYCDNRIDNLQSFTTEIGDGHHDVFHCPHCNKRLMVCLNVTVEYYVEPIEWWDDYANEGEND